MEHGREVTLLDGDVSALISPRGWDLARETGIRHSSDRLCRLRDCPAPGGGHLRGGEPLPGGTR